MKRKKQILEHIQEVFRHHSTDANADEYQTVALECWYDDIIENDDLIEILMEIKHR